MSARLLWYDQLLTTMGDANDPTVAAGRCAGFDIIIIPDNSGSDAQSVENRTADLQVIEMAQTINFDLRFFVAVDLSTAVEGVTIAAIRAAYGARIAGIALFNCNYGVYSGNTVDRPLQLAIYNDISSGNLAAIFLCTDYRGLIESFQDDTYNPNGEGLPILPSDAVVLLVHSSNDVPTCDSMIFQYLLAQSYKFNRNTQLGTLYQYSIFPEYEGATDLQYWYNLSGFFGDALVGFSTVDNFAADGEGDVSVLNLISPYATASNWRYTRVSNRAVQREDGTLLTFTTNTIDSGQFSV